MSLQHPLARVKGLGASGEGSHHWWLQRTSALTLIPLSIWFVFSILQRIGEEQVSIQSWIAEPMVALLLTLYLVFMFFHGQLGLQVVIEDYVHGKRKRMTLLLVVKGAMIFAALASIFSVLRIAL
ncbi:MAG: succinate dehydrogenase, hydrophobic membrane anchor protein [Gammaproteobacteria bacterium]|nr:succinate dehydrogenase, hydrophobic membrane anchor protein [Gammaproteobacteria bacterium]